MANYTLTNTAKEDLRRIYTYGFEAWGGSAADTYYNALFDRFELIAKNPYLYPAVDFIRMGYRRSVYGTDSIYYRIGKDGVEIMAIIGHQDTETAL